MRLGALLTNHKTFLVLLTTIVLMELAHGIELIALFPLYLSESMHEGADVIGITLSTYLVTDIIMRTPVGWAADRWGRKSMLMLGTALSALPLLAMMRVDSPTVFLFLNAINGIGAGFIWPSIYAAVADAYGRERYGLVLGIINMVMLGGIALGPIAGGLLLSRVSHETAFLVCFVIVVIAFAMVALFMRDRSVREHIPSELDSVRVLIQQINPSLVRLLVIGVLLTLALGILLPLISLFGRDVLHLTPEAFAFVLIPPGIVTAALIVPAGHWADKRGRHVPMILGLAGVAIPFALSPISTNPFIVSAGGIVAGVGYALVAPAWNALVMEWIPSGSRGLFLGAIAALQGVGLAIGPIIGGMLWERIGEYAPFGSSAILLVGAVALSFWDLRLMCVSLSK